MAKTNGKRQKGFSGTPHDSAFKWFLTQPDIAKDFMALHLPAELQSICDLNTLKLESGSFVEESLRLCYSDILYSVKTTEGNGYIHVLIEHQSTPDRHMGFRLLRYAVAAMQRHLDAGYSQLPLVIPILFYTGRQSPYPYSTNWLAEFDNPALAEKIYTASFALVDVTVIPDDDIMSHRSMAALTLLQKHIYQRDLIDMVNRLAEVLLNGYLTGQQLVSLINYLIQAGEASNAKIFIRELAQRLPQHKDELMTIAQQLEQAGIEKGIEKGIQLGEQRGIEKGRKEEALKIAQAMLKNGLERATILKLTDLTEGDLAQIHH
ncbi:Rpn family recombination-promoting nuclease/putative transposase [Pantoea sp. MBD-2R]|uniref:Rpn family recombination-promoting nuclease/putative transposase n=1 Tax=Pantoea sp. MBD-2R TaxID=3141540 RepID=UPI003183CB28